MQGATIHFNRVIVLGLKQLRNCVQSGAIIKEVVLVVDSPELLGKAQICLLLLLERFSIHSGLCKSLQYDFSFQCDLINSNIIKHMTINCSHYLS